MRSLTLVGRYKCEEARDISDGCHFGPWFRIAQLMADGFGLIKRYETVQHCAVD